MSDDQITSPKFKSNDTDRLPSEVEVNLTVIEGKQKGKSFKLTKYETTLGRSKCDITIDDSEASRQHAKLEFEAGAFHLEDLKSSNGTYVNGKRIDRRKLNDQDHILLGDTVLAFAAASPRLWQEEDTNPSIALTQERATGERKFVTILFADVSGFSGLAEQMDPEELTSMMNGCFEQLIKTVYRYRGTVDKLIGDCIMVLFGAPISHEDDGERSLLCALEMIQATDAYAEKIGLPIRISIGINAGNVLAGTVGSELRRDYTVMGNAVNLAQKLQKQAQPGEVRVTEDVVRLVGKEFEFDTLPPFTVRGVSQPISQYLLLRARPLRVRAVTSNITLPLIGRRKELGLLKHYCDQAIAGQARVVFLSGDMGIGKSRLAKELALYAMAKGLKPTRVVARSIQSNQPYAFIVSLLCALLEIESQEELENSTVITSRLQGYGLEETESNALIELFPEFNTPNLNRETPIAIRQNLIVQSLQKLVQKLQVDSPLFFHFDALQWIDPLSRLILQRVLPLLDGKVFTLLVAREVDKDFALSAKLELNHLTNEDATEYIQKLLATNQTPPSLIDIVIARSGGVPIFIEEILATLSRDSNSGIEMHQSFDAQSISPNITTVLQARIDQLPAHIREVLKVAAAMGQEFDPRLLSQIIDQGDETHTSSAITFLCEAGILEEVSEFDPPLFRFRNDIFREVTLANLLKEQLRRILKSVANVMEQTFTKSAPIAYFNFATLGQYFEGAGDYLKAVEYFNRAAESMAGNGDNKTAIAFYHRACQLLEREYPEQRETIHQINIKIGQLTSLSNDFAEALRLFVSIREQLRNETRSSAKQLATLATKEIGRMQRLLGKLVESEATLKELLTQLGDDVELKIEVQRELGVALFQAGRYDEALGFYTSALKKAKALKDNLLIARCLNEIGLVHTYKGDLGSALNFFIESLSLRESSGSQHSIAIVLPNIANAYHQLGEHQKALDFYQRAMQITQSIGDRRTHVVVLNNMADVLMDQEQFPQAKQMYDQVLTITQQLNYNDLRNLASIHRTLIDVVESSVVELPALQARLEQYSHEAEFDHLAFNVITAKYVLAIATARQNQTDKARQLFETALQEAKSIGNQPLITVIKKRMQQFL